MVFCVQAELAFGTAKIRDQVLAFLQQKVAAAEKWDGTTLVSEAVGPGTNGLRMEVRFTTRPAQVDVLESTSAFTVGARAPWPGSWMRLHDCRHDEGGACSGVSERRW